MTICQGDFSLAHYQETLRKWQHAGYRGTSFRDHEEKALSGGKTLILRHDLDFRRCPASAPAMGRIEKELGFTSTFFVRIHSDEYNPAEFNTYLIFRDLLRQGHEIGLHFECYEFAEVTGEDEAAAFRKGKAFLETLFDIPIVSACEHGDYHRFSKAGFRRFFARHRPEDFGIRHDPYQPRYFTEMKYLSDSNQRWREGCFCEHPGKHAAVQVATHPGFWYSEHYVLSEPVSHDRSHPPA